MPTPACTLCTGPEDSSLEYTLESTAETMSSTTRSAAPPIVFDESLSICCFRAIGV